MSVFLFVSLISWGCLCRGQPHELQIRDCLPTRPKYLSAVARAHFFMEECLLTFKMGVTGREKHSDFDYMWNESKAIAMGSRHGWMITGTSKAVFEIWKSPVALM